MVLFEEVGGIQMRSTLTVTGGTDRLTPCADKLPSDHNRGPGFVAAFSNSDFTVVIDQYAVVYGLWDHSYSGAGAVAEVSDATTCRAYTSRDGRSELTGSFELGSIQGVDGQFAFCERIGEVGGGCSAYLSKRDVLSMIKVRAPTVNDAQRLLVLLVPRVVAALQ
jgi:hypothetical protein